MAFLVGLFTTAGTGAVAGGVATVSAGVEATVVSGGVEAANSLEAIAQNEMMTAPEGMIEEPQLNRNSLEQKNEKKSSFDIGREAEKAFFQEQFHAAENRRKEVENQLGK